MYTKIKVRRTEVRVFLVPGYFICVTDREFVTFDNNGQVYDKSMRNVDLLQDIKEALSDIVSNDPLVVEYLRHLKFDKLSKRRDRMIAQMHKLQDDVWNIENEMREI